MSFESLSGVSLEIATLLRRFGVGQMASREKRSAMCIVASIVNLGHIEHLFGAMCSFALAEAMCERARELCRTHEGILAVSAEKMVFIFDSMPAAGVGSDQYRTLPVHLLDSVLAQLSEGPVHFGAVLMYPLIEANIARFDALPFDISRISGGTAGRREIGEAEFVADTQVAQQVLDALRDGELEFDFERICDARDPSVTLYFEALLCRSGDESRERYRLGPKVSALERLGVVRHLDRWVVGAIIDKLRADPQARLGCNISARSAVVDGWWAKIFTSLAMEPDVASRLVVEITETYPITNLDATRDFIAALKSLGGHIALDDVGPDLDGLGSLIKLGFDVVKIDRSLITSCRLGEEAIARFAQLIELVRAFDSAIIVEGVETESEAKIATACGATGLQGHLFTPPIQSPNARSHAGA